MRMASASGAAVDRCECGQISVIVWSCYVWWFGRWNGVIRKALLSD